MGLLQYPKGTFSWDCLRGLAGLTLVAPLLVLGSPGAFTGLVLASVAGLFLVFIYSAWQRTGDGFDLSEDCLVRNPDGSRMHWSSLSALTLAYYTTRQDQRSGWWELKLAADTQVTKVDSRLVGFEPLLQRALRAARDNHLDLSPVTCMNATYLFGYTVELEPAHGQG